MLREIFLYFYKLKKRRRRKGFYIMAPPKKLFCFAPARRYMKYIHASEETEDIYSQRYSLRLNKIKTCINHSADACNANQKRQLQQE